MGSNLRTNECGRSFIGDDDAESSIKSTRNYLFSVKKEERSWKYYLNHI